MNLHPKVKAGAGVAGAVAALVVAAFGVAGVDLSSQEQAITVVIAAALPVLAGYLKKA